ncbi:unnamed protein product [Penicillium camemberti]|uniref:Str. FM013 n=1 Tax=Penicillium camemberti (strain FM 013) TaxID=1429867 RepID=A0A0G4PAZ5_PENC3|nr:unnamed protein product [Penicillium camemberti]
MIQRSELVQGDAGFRVSSTVDPRDVPDRSLFANSKLSTTDTEASLTYSTLHILHPSILVLTKPKPWYTSQLFQDLAVYMRSRAHLTDIMSALQWLSDEELRIDLDAYSGVPRRELMQLLCKLYTAHRQARP